MMHGYRFNYPAVYKAIPIVAPPQHIDIKVLLTYPCMSNNDPGTLTGAILHNETLQVHFVANTHVLSLQ